MARIEKGLHEHHAAYQKALAEGTGLAAESSAPVPHQPASSASTDGPAIESAFAKVNSVVAGSPADDAGLEAGDELTRFGEANFLNHEKLARVAQIVQRNIGVCDLCMHVG